MDLTIRGMSGEQIERQMQPLGSPTEQPSVFTRSPRITLIGNAGYPSRGLGQPPIPELRTDD